MIKIRHRLFLARDRMGKKPLYYYADNEKFIFASEINAFKTIDINLTIDINAIDMFLEYQFIPYPFTIFNGIKKYPLQVIFYLVENGGYVPNNIFFIVKRQGFAITISKWFNAEFSDIVQKYIVKNATLWA
ncbi:MAG: hypothetical protein QW474_02885 [Candidatus Aenigmatarchaeota archaeon]